MAQGAAGPGAGRPVRMGLKQKIFHELKIYWINVLYLAIFFSVFTNYKRLVLAHYQIHYGDYGISIIKALVLAKVILIVDHLRYGKGFEDKPLMVPTLYKSIIFMICVAIFTIIEVIVRNLLAGNGLFGAPGAPTRHSLYEWAAGALVVFCAFIPFFAMRELSRVLGQGVIPELFFHRKPPAA